MNLFEAFDKLRTLDEDTFDVTKDGVQKLKEFKDDDYTDELVSIYDANLDEDDDGCKCEEHNHKDDVILDCSVCHSKVYKNKKDIKLDEDADLANVGDECPYCHSNDGYKVVGQVKECDLREGKTTKEYRIIDQKTGKVLKTFKADEQQKGYSEMRRMGKELKDAGKEDNLIFKEFDVRLKENAEDVCPGCGKPVAECTCKNESMEATRSKRLEETAVALPTKKGTVANVLSAHMDELADIDSAAELKQKVIDIIDKSDIADKSNAAKLKRDLDRVRGGKHGLLSTIGTYITGIPAEPKGMRKSSRNESVTKSNRKLNEMKITQEMDLSDFDFWDGGKDTRDALTYDQLRDIEITLEGLYPNGITDEELNDLFWFERDQIAEWLGFYNWEELVTGEVTQEWDEDADKDWNFTESVDKKYSIKEDSLGDDVDKYQRWVDYDMKKYHKVSELTNRKIKNAGLQLVKDQYGDYEVTAGDDSISESRKKAVKEGQERKLREQGFDNSSFDYNFNVLSEIKKFNERISKADSNESFAELDKIRIDIENTIESLDKLQYRVQKDREQLHTFWYEKLLPHMDDAASRYGESFDKRKILRKISEAQTEKEYRIIDGETGKVLKTFKADEQQKGYTEMRRMGQELKKAGKEDNLIYKEFRVKLKESAESGRAFWDAGYKVGDKVQSDSFGEVEVIALDKNKDYAVFKRNEGLHPFIAAWAPQLNDDKVSWGQGHYFIDEDSAMEYLKNLKESINKRKLLRKISEALDEVEVKTSDMKLEVTSDENGKVTVSAEPEENDSEGLDTEEVVEPVSPETEMEIEGDFSEEPVDEFDEESFDEVVESYLKKINEDVCSYETRKVSLNNKNNRLVIEGLVREKDKTEKVTRFIFESTKPIGKGNLVLRGMNESLVKGSVNPYRLFVKNESGKIFTEGLKYRHSQKSNIGKTTVVEGFVKTKK